jgi:hypothetical protein
MNYTENSNSTFNSHTNSSKGLGRKLRLAGFKDYPPLVQFSKCPTWSMKMCPQPGSDVEFLRIVLKIAGIDYEVVQHVNVCFNNGILLQIFGIFCYLKLF